MSTRRRMSIIFEKSSASVRHKRESSPSLKIAEINTSFYHNVSLLAKAMPATDEFKKYFHEYMFNKPNTMGFIYVTHFLLTVYDAERFKKTVQWPVICRKTEAQYRNNVRSYLNELSSENLDIDFPPILASTLLHAGGTKFTIVMWKLSQLVFYNYVKRQNNENVLLLPKAGPGKELTRRMLCNVIYTKEIELEKQRKELSHFTEECRFFAETEADGINEIRSKLFEVRRTLEDLVSKAPTLPAIKNRLRNVDDVEIIEWILVSRRVRRILHYYMNLAWKAHIIERQNDLRKQNLRMSELESLSNDLKTIITNVCEPKILDANKLKKVDTSVISRLNLCSEIQVSASQLYANAKLPLASFLTLFCAILYKLRWHIKDKRWPDISHAQLQIQAFADDIHAMNNLFDTLFTRVKNLSWHMQNYIDQKNLMNIDTMNCVNFPDTYKALFIPSPKIEFNTIECKGRTFLNLELTPVEERHNSLFSRHKRGKDSTPRSSRICTNGLISRIKFDDTISSIINERQSPVRRRNESVLNASTVKGVRKYSRLFNNSSKNNNCNANFSVMSVPSNSKANSSVLINTKARPKVSLNVTAKDLFQLSKEVVHIASRISGPDPKNYLARTPVMNSELRNKTDFESLEPIAVIETIDCSEEKNIFEEISYNANVTTPKSTKDKGRRGRRSISDLVEQYKTLVDRSSIQSIHFESRNFNNSTEQD